MAMPLLDQISLLDVKFHKATAKDIVDIIYESINRDERHIIANHNLHSVYLCNNKRNPKMAHFYQTATCTFIDGMSLVLLCNLLGTSLKLQHRLTSLDFLPSILEHAKRNNWRNYYLGTKQELVEKGIGILKRNFNGLDIRFHNGYFNAQRNSDENKRIVQSINDYRPHILLVGMGMPRQEEWIIDNFEQLKVNVVFSIGAYIDYIAGDKPIPPRWLGHLGLEWLYRLLCEPRRLGQRYLIEPWFLLGLLIKHTSHSLNFKCLIRGHSKKQKEVIETNNDDRLAEKVHSKTT